jgi:hypothetical protein
MKSTAGQRVVQQLAAAADVIVENFLPGAASKMNISYDHVRALNPRAVYVSISGYGSSGPLANHPVNPHPPPPPSPQLHCPAYSTPPPSHLDMRVSRATISWRRQ